jgi:diguanylate cyclase (GGDEF)-like protein/PAS domain S-box-containing protein
MGGRERSTGDGAGASKQGGHQKASGSTADGCDDTFRHAFESAPIGMAIVGLDGRVLKANAALQELTGRSGDELLFMEPEELAHPDDAGLNAQEMRRVLESGEDSYRIEKRWTNASGHTLWVSVSASLVRDERGRPLFFVWHVVDGSARKREQRRLQERADHDALTRLINRERFYELLEDQIARCRRYGESAAVLVLDLDCFKQINDAHGHAAGDEALRSVATVLLESVRDSDVVARLGGDEFAVLLLHVSEDYAIEVADELQEAIEQLDVNGHAIGLGASIGSAFVSHATSDAEEVLAEADRAMYAAKRRGRGLVTATTRADDTRRESRPPSSRRRRPRFRHF